jgi:NAD(P)-dependent dehydrogenase (short-subunit alcohol dehydrogenase family)
MGTSLVTGANRGIGLELCRQLKARGDAVIAVCRRSSKALDALNIKVESGIDVSDEAAIATLRGRLEGVKLDLLVNNAGIYEDTSLDHLDLQSIRRQIEVNALGPLNVTATLRPLLGQGSKVAIITSRMGSIGDNSSGSQYGYRMSKAAVNAAGVSLAHDLRSQGIAVAIIHPGLVKTDLTRGHGIEAADSVRGILARLDALSIENSGSFWHATTSEVLPW